MNRRMAEWTTGSGIGSSWFGLSVPWQQQKQNKKESCQSVDLLVWLALCESCHKLLNQHIKSQILQRGQLERRTNTEETTEQNETRALTLPPTLTSTYQSCIVNFKYGLLKNTELLYKLDVLYCFDIGKKWYGREKNMKILKLNSDCLTNFHIASVCFSLHCLVNGWCEIWEVKH